MEEEKYIMFRNRLQKVFKHLRKQAARLQVGCYRIYDHDLPEFPFCIEIYEEKLYVAEYKRNHQMEETAHEEWLWQSIGVMREVLGIAAENIFLKLRQRKPGRLGQYQRIDSAKNEFIVIENGMKFIINLSDYLDTGLFLDHRDTRKLVMSQSEGKDVLNLFAYTGSFSVYAAKGGAKRVETVDLSNTYLNWAKRNFELNGWAENEQYRFIQADVKAYLKTVSAESFDIIVMDPPTFSNSKRMDDILDIQRDHVELINDCLKALRPNGVLYFSTNARKFQLNVEAINGVSKDITKATTPFDFEGKLHRLCYKIAK